MSKYFKDLAERVISTFVLAAAGTILMSGPVHMLSLSFWKSVALAGVVAVGSLLKGTAARGVGNKDSASLTKSV